MATPFNNPQLRFSFASKAPAGGDSFDVVKLKGFEAISRGFRFDLILMSSKADINFDAMLANPAELNIRAPNSKESTPYFGVLSEFEQLQQVGNIVFYRATLVPRLERLGLGRTSDVYLGGQTIPQVLDVVLKAGGLLSKDFAINPLRTYRSRDLVCQFQESFLNFVNRWLENEGMHYYYEHDAALGFEKLQVIDSQSQIPAAAVEVKYLPVESVAGANEPNLVQGFVRRQKPLAKQVVLQGFNYLDAKVVLEVTSPLSSAGQGDVMLYGENFLDEKEGKSYAEIRAQEIISRAVVFAGESTAQGLRSGYFLKLSGHYRPDVNGKYLVTDIQHSGSQAGFLLAGISSPYSDPSGETWYRNTFSALPEKVQFRPERTTPRPRIGGTMTATVDSEGSGDYAELDDKGRYKIRMPFMKATDKDGKPKTPMHASALVRMATPYSGGGHGMNFPLHKGAEVVLAFTDGDPDQPLILSAIPNSENLNLVTNANPAQSVIKTKGGNAMVIDDTKGVEYIKFTSPYNNSKLVVGYGGPPKDFSPFPAIWLGTSGSSESVTVGVSNAVKLGFNNSVNLSFDNSFSASMANKMAIGASASFAVGHDISWSHGKNIKIDDADSVVLKENGKLLANDKITIGGGQVKPITVAINATKKTVKNALMVSLAVNGAAAALAGAALTSAQKDGDKGKVDIKDESFGHWAARSLGLAGGAGSAIRVHTLLRSMGKAVALAGNDATFRSKVDLDSTGVDMSATNTAHTSTGRVITQSGGLKLWVGLEVPQPLAPLPPVPPVLALGSEVEVKQTEISLTARNVALLASRLSLDGDTAVMQAGLGAKVVLGNAGVEASFGTNKLSLEPLAGAVLEASATSKVMVQPMGVEARFGTNSVLIDVDGIKLASVAGVAVNAGPMLRLNAVTTKLNGALIQLG